MRATFSALRLTLVVFASFLALAWASTAPPARRAGVVAGPRRLGLAPTTPGGLGVPTRRYERAFTIGAEQDGPVAEATLSSRGEIGSTRNARLLDALTAGDQGTVVAATASSTASPGPGESHEGPPSSDSAREPRPLRKRCKYIGSFFRLCAPVFYHAPRSPRPEIDTNGELRSRIDCNAPANSTEIPYSHAQQAAPTLA